MYLPADGILWKPERVIIKHYYSYSSFQSKLKLTVFNCATYFNFKIFLYKIIQPTWKIIHCKLNTKDFNHYLSKNYWIQKVRKERVSAFESKPFQSSESKTCFSVESITMLYNKFCFTLKSSWNLFYV